MNLPPFVQRKYDEFDFHSFLVFIPFVCNKWICVWVTQTVYNPFNDALDGGNAYDGLILIDIRYVHESPLLNQILGLFSILERKFMFEL